MRAQNGPAAAIEGERECRSSWRSGDTEDVAVRAKQQVRRVKASLDNGIPGPPPGLERDPQIAGEPLHSLEPHESRLQRGVVRELDIRVAVTRAEVVAI